MTGNLYIVSAASGTGKTSLLDALIKDLENIKISISHTTRQKRPAEKEAINYYFITQEQFNTMCDKDEFLEHADVYGKCYGTAKHFVEQDLKKGLDVILEIDWQGARQVRSKRENITSIFILPPSKNALRERLTSRNQDSMEIIEKRLKAASEDISHYPEYDYLVVNDDFSHALNRLKSIILAKRCRLAPQHIKLQGLLNELIA